MNEGTAASTLSLGRPIAWGLRLILDAVLVLATAGYAAVTLATLFARDDWRADLLTHFRPHLLALAASLALVVVVARRRWLLVPLTLAAAVHGVVMLRPVPVPGASGAGPQLRLIEFNVFAENRDHEQVLTWLRLQQPDIVVLAEAYAPWQKRLSALATILPYSTAKPNGGADTVVLSRFPITSAKILYSKDADGRPTGTPIVRAELDVLGQHLVLYAVHPPSPMDGELWRTRNTMLRWVAAQAAAEDPAKPVIVAGDFNQTPWTPWHRAFLKRSGLIDAAGTRWPPATRHPLWPVQWRMLAVPIDHVTVRPGIGVTGFAVGPELGSDHYPTTVDLVLGRPPA